MKGEVLTPGRYRALEMVSDRGMISTYEFATEMWPGMGTARGEALASAWLRHMKSLGLLQLWKGRYELSARGLVCLLVTRHERRTA